MKVSTFILVSDIPAKPQMANDGNGGNETDPLLQPTLPPLPEPNDVATPTPSELKDQLIFGPYLIQAFSQNPSPSSSFLDFSTGHGFGRSRSAPNVTAAINDLPHPVDHVFHRSNTSSKSTVRQAVALLVVYLTVMSVATVVYGEEALKTLPGWLLAAIWLVVSTLAVALALLCLGKARVDKRNRELEKRVLGENMSISQFFAADMDNNGFVSKPEYVIYKLTQMEKITYKDIQLISDQFDKMDRANTGKITLPDLLEINTNGLSTAVPV